MKKWKYYLTFWSDEKKKYFETSIISEKSETTSALIEMARKKVKVQNLCLNQIVLINCTKAIND